MTVHSVLADRASEAASFGLAIDFQKHSENPSRVFSALTKLIDACQVVDRYLIKAIPVEVEPLLLLEDVQQGSIRVWLKNVFRSSDSRQTNNFSPDLLSDFLARSKYLIISYANGRTQITNQSLSDLQLNICAIANEINPTKDMPIYTDISKKNLLNSCREFQESLKPLDSEDKATMILPDGKEAPFNLVFDFSPSSIEDIITSQTIKNISTLILKIKKPDYLGSSKWEFFQEKVIEAKVIDFEWLTKFHKREFLLSPGDSIKADVEITAKYDIDNNLISTRHEVKKVLAVIQGAPTATPLFDLE